MRKIYALLAVMVFAYTSKAQLVFNENFTGYTNGNISTGGAPAPQGGWSTSGSGTDVQVASATPLTYSGYTSGTQYVTISGSSDRSVFKNFSATVSNSGTRYIFTSFVVRVSSSVSPASSSIRLLDAGSNILYSFYAQNDGSNHVEFGLNVGGSSNSVFTTNNYAFNTTYFIVIRYDIVNGNNNDNVRLWVNPSTGSTEPANASPTISILSSNDEAGYGNVARMQLRQVSGTTGTPVAAFDAFRVATGTTTALAWQNLSPQGAPLPVKLDNFDAAKDGSGVKLVWNTSDELGVSNYQIERSQNGFDFTSIGTVTADKRKMYSFTDIQPAADNNFYRLKMVDLDGNFKLSHVVSIKSKASVNIILSPNPVKDKLLVQHPKATTACSIQVVNADGRVISETQIPVNAVQTAIDLSGQRSGLYHIVFKTATGLYSNTIIKQ